MMGRQIRVLKSVIDGKKKDNRIKVIHQQNQGVSVARNVGIEKSNGNT